MFALVNTKKIKQHWFLSQVPDIMQQFNSKAALPRCVPFVVPFSRYLYLCLSAY